jgi:hypothetical protein
VAVKILEKITKSKITTMLTELSEKYKNSKIRTSSISNPAIRNNRNQEPTIPNHGICRVW